MGRCLAGRVYVGLADSRFGGPERLVRVWGSNRPCERRRGQFVDNDHPFGRGSELELDGSARVQVRLDNLLAFVAFPQGVLVPVLVPHSERARLVDRDGALAGDIWARGPIVERV